MKLQKNRKIIKVIRSKNEKIMLTTTNVEN